MVLPILMSFLPLSLGDQAYAANNNVKITVNGTSNIHDWDLVSDKGTCTMTVDMDAAGVITAFRNLSFTLPVNTLKSKHGEKMDNNAYKAMNASTYPTVAFKSASVSLKNSGANTYSVSAPGKLTINNVIRDVTLTGSCKVNADKSVNVTGSYKLTTTDYNVKPISIMLGAIKTGAGVTILYNLTAKPQ
jgi:polyisoprenoid-binding protein YceI